MAPQSSLLGTLADLIEILEQPTLDLQALRPLALENVNGQSMGIFAARVSVSSTPTARSQRAVAPTR